MGAHERFNRRWLREHGAGLKQRRLDQFPGWLDEWLLDGNLAAAAWSAYTRIPRTGTEQIVQLLHESNANQTSHSTANGDFLTAVPRSRTAKAMSHA